MNKKIYRYFFLLLLTIAFPQIKAQQDNSSIVDEGKMLYRLEMASWYGTDIFLEKLTDRRTNSGGYFSYLDNNTPKCIFFSKGEQPKVIGTISFGKSYDVKTAILDSSERNFTNNEMDIYNVRKKALIEIQTDTLFKIYKNTDLNLIPIAGNGEKKVYVLTGPSASGVVIFGNDYLLTFDKDNNLKDKRKLHHDIIVHKFSQSKKGDTNEVSAMHTHLRVTGDYITATDICTLMLYENFTKWTQYYVFSENFVSIWDCKTNELKTVTREFWNNMVKLSKKLEAH